MKLLGLTCDTPSFRPLAFRPRGLSLIVGRGKEDSIGPVSAPPPPRPPAREDDSSNGVGKTLALKLVHHCLAARGTPLGVFAGDWMFWLDIELDGRQHRLGRSGNGKVQSRDGTPLSLSGQWDWLNGCGAFPGIASLPSLSFRALFKRFARPEQTDCQNPLTTAREQDWEALLRSCWLLGIAPGPVYDRRNTIVALNDLVKEKKRLESEGAREGQEALGQSARRTVLEREISQLETAVQQCRTDDRYQQVQERCDQLGNQLQELERRRGELAFRLNSVTNSLQQTPDITLAQLHDLYHGLTDLFVPQALARLEEVEAFHQALTADRQVRLEGRKQEIQRELADIARQQDTLQARRGEELRFLQEMTPLEQFFSMQRQLADLKAEYRQLSSNRDSISHIEEQISALKKEMIDANEMTRQWLQQEPLAEKTRFFIELAEILYPGRQAALSLENARSDKSSLRYTLEAYLEGESADGINAARILCMDYLILTRGANHTVDMLWHDNRLFADMDPLVRARWFSHVMHDSASKNKQYIASLNQENLDSMRDHLSAEDQEQLEQCIILTLGGDDPSQKLMGVQFDTVNSS